MKQLATILCLGIIGFAQAQSTSKDVEIYERYENGELVEQRQSATENGVPIENFDFEKAKREMQLKSAGMEERMEEMSRKMELKMSEMKQKMDAFQGRMDQKMQEFEKRSEEMHKKMDQKMKENENKNSEMKKSPIPSEEPTSIQSSKEVKFT